MPGHTQRGGTPCPYDRVLATDLEQQQQSNLNDDYGYMVGHDKRRDIKVPLSEVAGKLKMMIDPKAESDHQRSKNSIGISFGD